MSTRVNLHFQTRIDLEFLSQGIHLRLIRLLGTVQLKTPGGWSKETQVIVDTGNPISLVPYSIWSGAEYRLLVQGKTKLFGLGADEQGGLSGTLGEVTLVFKDQQTTSSAIKCKAHLMEDDSAPFLIGFEDILTEAELACHYKSQLAWIEM